MIVLSTRRKPTSYSGKLICAEGGDASGKTSALTAVYNRLKDEGRDVIWTEWDDSKLVGKALKKGKKKRRMTPLTFVLLQATNIADRLQSTILPALRRGAIVIADRWKYTCYARDAVRGADRDYIRSVFEFCPDADLAMYFKVDASVALERKRTLDDEGIKYYEAGADLFPELSREEGFVRFQTLVNREYERFAKDESMVTVDADRDMATVEAECQRLVVGVIGKLKKAA